MSFQTCRLRTSVFAACRLFAPHWNGAVATANDPWNRLFSLAARDCGENSAGIMPYWVFTVEGGATIERHVPALPLSREAKHLPALRSSLAVYRMVFGQPQHGDLELLVPPCWEKEARGLDGPIDQ